MDNSLASYSESFVKLVLHLSIHDKYYLDSYFGPKGWLTEATRSPLSVDQIILKANDLLEDLEKINSTSNDDMKIQVLYLEKNLIALRTRAEMIQGRKFSFDDETNLFFDIHVRSLDDKEIDRISRDLNDSLPGNGTFNERFEQLRKSFLLPKDKISLLFNRAIQEVRRRTKDLITLPQSENCQIEFVSNQSWIAYSWYKGSFQSLIQINSDYPIYLNSILHYASHEGYPGHHTFTSLIDYHLVKNRRLIEYTVNPLFSPVSVLNEGLADFAIDVIFPGSDRITFEQDVLCPLAGISSNGLDTYHSVLSLLPSYQSLLIEFSRRYLNGILTKDELVQQLLTISPYDELELRKIVSFIDFYRSYVINYGMGYEIVEKFIESNGGTLSDLYKRRELYCRLLSRPHLPSELVL